MTWENLTPAVNAGGVANSRVVICYSISKPVEENEGIRGIYEKDEH